MKSTKHCPRCHAQLVVRQSSLGPYLICPNYPNCDSPVELRQPPMPAVEFAQAA